MDAIGPFFRWLNETTGINFPVFYDAYDFGAFLDGLENTVTLSLLTILASIVIGILGAWLQGVRSGIVRGGIAAFVSLFRNTPPLVQLFFFYFGVGTLLPASYNEIGLRQPFFTNYEWAVISLSLFAGAFNIEIFRSGIEAVPQTTIEAAEALGYTRARSYLHVVLPLAVRVCLPALANNLVNLLKTTTLAYAIAVPEVLYQVRQMWAISQNVPEMMFLLLVVYIGLVGILVLIMHLCERWLRIPGYVR